MTGHTTVTASVRVALPTRVLVGELTLVLTEEEAQLFGYGEEGYSLYGFGGGIPQLPTDAGV
jgi:hypothetical protein